MDEICQNASAYLTAKAAQTIAIKTTAEISAEVHALFRYAVGTSGAGGKLYASGLPRITKKA